MPHRGPHNYLPYKIGVTGRDFHAAQEVIFTSENNSFKSIRAALSPLLCSTGIARFIPSMLKSADMTAQIALKASSEGRGEVDVYDLAGKITSHNTVLISCGVDVFNLEYGKSAKGSGCDISARVQLLQRAVNRMTTAPVLTMLAAVLLVLAPFWLQPYVAVPPFWLAALFPFSNEHALSQDRQRIVGSTLALVNAARRKLGEGVKCKVPEKYVLGMTPEEGSVVQVLATARDPRTKLPYDDMQIAWNAMLMLSSGLSSPQTTIAFTLTLLARHPACQNRAAKECAAADLTQITSADELDRTLPYTRACILEAMRMYPPGFVTTRQAATDVHVGPHRAHLPKGTSVLINIFGIHNNPAHWPEPAKFRPERHMEGNPELGVRHPYAFMPYGLGHRDCLGKKVSSLQNLLSVAALLKAVRFETEAASMDATIAINRMSVLSLGPAGSMMLQVTPRTND